MSDIVKRARKHAKDVLDQGYPYYGTPELVREMADEIACLRLTDAEWVVLGKVLRRLRESMWRDSSIELVQMASVIDGLLERHKGGGR